MAIHPSQWRHPNFKQRVDACPLCRRAGAAAPEKGSLRHMMLSCVSPEIRPLIQEMRGAEHDHLLQIYNPVPGGALGPGRWPLLMQTGFMLPAAPPREAALLSGTELETANELGYRGVVPLGLTRRFRGDRSAKTSPAKALIHIVLVYAQRIRQMAAKTCARMELDTPVGHAPVAPAPAPAAPPVVGAPAPPARPRCTGPICRENMNLYGIQGRMYNPRARPPQHECTVCAKVVPSGSHW